MVIHTKQIGHYHSLRKFALDIGLNLSGNNTSIGNRLKPNWGSNLLINTIHNRI